MKSTTSADQIPHTEEAPGAAEAVNGQSHGEVWNEGRSLEGLLETFSSPRSNPPPAPGLADGPVVRGKKSSPAKKPSTKQRVRISRKDRDAKIREKYTYRPKGKAISESGDQAVPAIPSDSRPADGTGHLGLPTVPDPEASACSIIKSIVGDPTSTSMQQGAISMFPVVPVPAGSPLEVLRALISSVDTLPLLELAEVLLKIPQTGENGRARKQPDKELAILVIAFLKRLVTNTGLGLCYVEEAPWFYTGVHWSEIAEEDFRKVLGSLAECMGCPIVTSLSFEFREKLFKQFRSEFRSSAWRADRTKVLINLQNGTLEIINGDLKLREFRQSDCLKYVLPYAYDPAAICPRFQAFLDHVLPDREMQEILAEFLGWPFLRDLKLEKALLLYGPGGNGKSVVFDIVNAVYGAENISHVDLPALAKPENRSALSSTILNYCSELGDRCQANILKAMSSGEAITARRLYRNSYMMTDYAKLAFNTNELPKAVELSDGFFRRFIILPFNKVISNEEKDPDLARKIIEKELPGVLNWVIQGLLRLNVNRKFTECRAVDAILLDYMQESDSAWLFMDELGIEPHDDGKIMKNDLFEDYRDYCLSSGLTKMSKNAFGKRLLSKYAIKDGKTGDTRYWRLMRRNAAVP